MVCSTGKEYALYLALAEEKVKKEQKLTCGVYIWGCREVL
jgi:hypothetical protein